VRKSDTPLNPVAVIPGGRVIGPLEACHAVLGYDTGCPECGKPLHVIRGKGGPHFRHRAGEKHDPANDPQQHQ
jgi:hypothetical protein